MLNRRKVVWTIIVVIASLGALGGLLWYYQSQGLIKIFPTAEERAIKKLLEVDETKFLPPEGLTQEQYDIEVKTLYERRDRVKTSPQDADAWSKYGYSLEFFNVHNQAVAAWEKAIELQPQNFAVAVSLANVYQYFLKDYPKAQKYYLQSLLGAPAYTSAYEGLMDLYRFNWREKKELYEPLILTAVAEDVQNQAYYYKELVDFLVNENEVTKAKQYLEILRELNELAANELVLEYPVLR